MKHHVSRGWLYIAIAGTAAPTIQQARAQSDTAAPTAATEESTESVLIVTPQKREQFLQDVPISVIPVSEMVLNETGIRNIKDLTILAPGVIVTSTTNETATTARIRGIG